MNLRDDTGRIKRYAGDVSRFYTEDAGGSSPSSPTISKLNPHAALRLLGVLQFLIVVMGNRQKLQKNYTFRREMELCSLRKSVGG